MIETILITVIAAVFIATAEYEKNLLRLEAVMRPRRAPKSGLTRRCAKSRTRPGPRIS